MEVNDVVRKTYVDVASKDFTLPGRKLSVSRISVLSGMSRKEISKWLNQLSGSDIAYEKVRQPINRATRIITAWSNDKSYITKNGLPRILTLEGEGKTFKSLVSEYGGDVTSGAVLDELRRVGSVEIIDDDKVKLIQDAYVPSKSEQELITILGTCVYDLINTSDFNIQHPDQTRFQREVVFNNLSLSSIEEFRLISKEKCSALTSDLQSWLSEKRELDKKLGRLDPASRVGVGIYYIENNRNKE